jgi:serine protease Do
MSRRLLLTFALLFLCVPQQAVAQAGGVESLRQTSKAFATVARKVAPSVVFIQVEGRQAVRSEALPFGDDLLRRFFGEDFPGLARPGTPGRSRKVSSQGSGFVFASNGGTTYILTNSHVLENAERIRVRFQDGREFDARIRGSDPKSDVAVIEIAARDLPALAWGDSANLEVGEWVVAMGNPFGLSHTLTVGVVSAKGRTSLGINDYEDFIQTDAAINPGNSGGPLVNLNAEVVGMNTAIFSRSGGYMGVGFAIPSKLARTIAEQLVAQGRVIRGYLGVTVQKLTTDVAAPLGLKEGQGVLVAEVGEGSPGYAPATCCSASTTPR